MKHKIFQWKYYTPKKGKRMVTLMRYGEWLTVYRKEVFLAHESHENILFGAGLEPCEGVKIYRTKRDAVKGKNNFHVRPTE